MSKIGAQGYIISLRVEADTVEQAIASFETTAAQMKEYAYQRSYGSGGGGYPTVMVAITGPRPAPLTDVEIEKLRGLLLIPTEQVK